MTAAAKGLCSAINAGCAEFDLPVEVFGSKLMATNDRGTRGDQREGELE